MENDEHELSIERTTAIGIIQVFEELLDSKDITIPNDEREGDESEARIYGSDYYHCEDKIVEILKSYKKQVLLCRVIK